MSSGLGVDFKHLSEMIKPKHFKKLTKNLDGYEKRVREAVHSLDLKSQQARKASETRLREVSEQIKKTRGEVERRVKGLLEDEAKKLNVRLREIYSYLVKVAQKEQEALTPKSRGTKKASGAKKASSKSASAKKTKSAGPKSTAPKAPRKARAKSAQVAMEMSDTVAEDKSPTTPVH